MELAQKLQKLESIRRGPPRVIFGYRYCSSKLADYVSLTNLRLEIVQVNNEQVQYTMAAPVLEVRHGKNYVEFHDHDLVVPVDGPRANILLRSRYLKAGETASPASMCFTVEVTSDSDERLLSRVCDICSKPAFPGIDMRMPVFYRCTKNPSRLRLNYVPELLQALGLEAGTAQEVLKSSFLASLHSVAIPTDEGWVVPFEWVYAGGMVVTPVADLGKRCPKVLHVRSPQFFNNYVNAKGWQLKCI